MKMIALTSFSGSNQFLAELTKLAYPTFIHCTGIEKRIGR